MATTLERLASASDLEVAALQARGLPASLVDSVSALFGVSRQRLMQALDLKGSTIARRLAAGERLSRDESEALSRVVRLYRQAEGALEKPGSWFLADNPTLGGPCPLDIAGTEAGGRVVEATLRRIEFGSVA